MVWGTLEPIAAYLLALGAAASRPEAEQEAEVYYRHQPQHIDPQDLLNAAAIRVWVQRRLAQDQPRAAGSRPFSSPVQLLRDFRRAPRTTWRVVPVDRGEYIDWYDVAGFPLARSQRPDEWEAGLDTTEGR